MKRLYFTMLCPLTLLAQWSDNFSTDLSNWTGDTAFFEIDTINHQGKIVKAKKTCVLGGRL